MGADSVYGACVLNITKAKQSKFQTEKMKNDRQNRIKVKKVKNRSVQRESTLNRKEKHLKNRKSEMFAFGFRSLELNERKQVLGKQPLGERHCSNPDSKYFVF